MLKLDIICYRVMNTISGHDAKKVRLVELNLWLEKREVGDCNGPIKR